jgi:hypothetical protein
MVHDRQLAFASVGTDIRVVVVPAVGGKIVSITGPAGTEHVWRQPGRTVQPITDTRDFADADISGLDDCFPTVDPCADPDRPGTAAQLRDHGDVWHRSWEPTVSASVLSLRTTGTDLPYALTKHLTVAGNRLLVEYDLTTTGVCFTYQWTGHLLLAGTPDGRIALTGNPSARVAFASTGRLRADAGRWTWPYAPTTDPSLPTTDREHVDLSVMSPRDAGLNEKVWLTSPTDGSCRLEPPAGQVDAAESVVVEFDPLLLPWLAICTDYGGWPADDPAYWIAIEPSTAGSDALADSVRAGTARTVEAGETHRWWWSLRLDSPSPQHTT